MDKTWIKHGLSWIISMITVYTVVIGDDDNADHITQLQLDVNCVQSFIL